MQNNRVFTLEEANALLPEVHQKVTALLEKKEACQRRHDQIFMHVLLHEAEGFHGDADESERVEAEIHDMESNILDLEKDLKAIRQLGCVIRNLDRGFVDFLSKTERGEWIYYCWKFGEDKIAYYHPLKEGMKQRIPLA